MLYWSVGGASDAARYIHRTTLDVATAADNIQQFIDVRFSTAHHDDDDDDTATQDIVIDVRTRRFIHTCITNSLTNLIKSNDRASYSP